MMTLRNKQRRGFTLIEVAIVTGVVGSLIGGIWLAASAVQQKKATTKAATEIGYIVNRLQSLNAINPAALYVAKDGGCVAGIPVITGASLTSNVSAGIFPEEMISGTTAAPIVSSPWGSGDIGLVVNAASNTCGVNGANSNPGSPGYVPVPLDYANSFSLTYLAMPVSACEQLLLSKGIGFTNMGMTQVCIGTQNSNACTMGSAVSPSTILAILTEANVNTYCTMNSSLSASNKVSVQLTFSTISP